MTFLPIVERELRVAARKRGTFWLRVVAALVSLLIGGGCLVISGLGGLRGVEMGIVLFNVLTWMAMAVALVAGLFFTSDCLSEEKREGTLGFLFLTDLRGYDVVGGKLLATSLRGGYALLAVFPVLAITLLMGGVNGAQFWKTVLALVNLLFYSLAVGLLISAVSGDGQKALLSVVVALVLLVGGGPLGDHMLAESRGGTFQPWLSLTSPAYAFMAASAWGRNPYWLALFLSHALAWLWFGLASALLPRLWQQGAKKETVAPSNRAYGRRYGNPVRRAALRRTLLDRNPILWLVSRERWQFWLAWGIAGLLVAKGLALLWFRNMVVVAIWGGLTSLFLLLLYLWTASQAGRFFVESRRSGLLELLAVSPLPVSEMVQGQWRALLRMFGWPVAVVLVIQVVTTLLAEPITFGRATVGPMMPGQSLWLMAVLALASALGTAANLVAVAWFGMWMGLTSRNVNLATLKTILFVEIIPWLVIGFLSGLVSAVLIIPQVSRMSAGGPAAMSGVMNVAAIMALVQVAFSLAKDAGFVVWSRKRLLRTIHLQGIVQIGPARPAPLPPPQPPLAPAAAS